MRSLSEALTTLNDLQDERRIAQVLRDAGITGDRNECHTCPLAKWVLRETGAVRVSVDTWGTDVTYEDGRTEYEPHGYTVTEFIRAFDDWEYPELDNHPSPEL